MRNAVRSWRHSIPHLQSLLHLAKGELLSDLSVTLGGIDFAPFIAMLAIWLIQMFLVNTLRDLALRMG